MNSIVNILIYDCYDVFQHKIWKTESIFQAQKCPEKKTISTTTYFGVVMNGVASNL